MPASGNRRTFLRYAFGLTGSGMGLSLLGACSTPRTYPGESDEACAEEPEDPLDIGLSLSGGGYRAMLFNLGSLWRLNDFGLLRRLDMIASVSGGSIVNRLLATRWRDLQFVQGGLGWQAINFQGEIVEPIRAFARETIDVPSVLERLVLGSASNQIARQYDDHLYKGRRLQQDVPEFDKGSAPRFLFYSTNLQTGSSVRIERKRLADYRVGEIQNPDLPVSLVVAASSAFPPFLSPVKLTFDESQWVDRCGAYLYPYPEFRREVLLTDGGVYDNMATEVIWDRCNTVLVSDAGAPLDATPSPSTLWISQLRRILDIEAEQTRALRRRELVAQFTKHKQGHSDARSDRGGTYWGIKTRIDQYQVPGALARDSTVTHDLRDIPTRLGGFSEQQQGQLINWGYALTDAAIRRWVYEDAPRAAGLPLPAFPL